MRLFALMALCLPGAWAQIRWPPKWDNFQFTFEFRSRQESRTGVGFGRDPDIENPLLRTRIGASWTALPWLKVSALGQDARAPLYGTAAPGSLRDTMDLQESYIELFPGRKRGFGAVVGRQMLSYGEGRLIGTPQWVNTARTYDTVRAYYRLPRARIEFLLVSVVKVAPDAYNKPVLGDRVWGMYHTFPELIPRGLVEVYVLRRDQNRPGGITGAGTVGINTFGGRATGPLPLGFRYSLEGAAQTGRVGPQTHRAGAWFSNLSRKVKLLLPVDLAVEYKFASGTDDSQGNRSGTFDQLYPAAHDKLGHLDLVGWRNIHNLRSLDVIHVTKGFALNVMYDSWWLDSATDWLYSAQGRPILRSARGDAGTHVGQEIDIYATYNRGPFQIGAGFGRLFAGEFLKNTTPGVNTRFLYLFQSYSF